MERSSSMKKKRFIICAAIPGVLLSFMFWVGRDFVSFDGVDWESGFLLAKILLTAVVTTGMIVVVFAKYDAFMSWLERVGNPFWDRIMKNLSVAGRFRLVWGILFSCWLLGLLAAFPGIFGVDAGYELYWYQMGQLTAHHPLLHTYMVGLCLNAGYALTGQYEWGMFFYSLVQMVILSGIFSYVWMVFNRKLPKWVSAMWVLMTALCPYVVILSFTATKDSLFTGFFLLFVVETWNMVSDIDQWLQKRNMIGYVATAFIASAFRNTGFYVVVAFFLLLLIAFRKRWKQILLMAVSFVVIWMIYTGPVYKMLNVQGGSPAEMVSVPMQQMARVMCTARDQISKEDQDLIAEYIPDWERYTPRVADSIKDTFNAELLRNHPVAFMKLWTRVGLRCPAVYTDAWASVTIGFWYTEMQYPDPGAYMPYIEYVDDMAYDSPSGVKENAWVGIEHHSLLPSLDSFLKWFVEKTPLQSEPVISWIFNGASAFWVILILSFKAIYERRWRVILMALLFFLLWGTLMLSPVVLMRYSFPLIMAQPIMLCLGRREELRAV